jgi:hypothetical protein
MTSTTTVARNDVASLGTAAAAGTGTEHAPAGREEATPGSTPGAGTPDDTGRAQRLVWLDPAGLAVHPRNVRDDLGDLSGLAASIAAQGVLEALTVVPITSADSTPGHQLVAGTAARPPRSSPASAWCRACCATTSPPQRTAPTATVPGRPGTSRRCSPRTCTARG